MIPLSFGTSAARLHSPKAGVTPSGLGVVIVPPHGIEALAAAKSLRLLADAVIDTRFRGQVTAGHCCALARQDSDEAKRTIERVAEAGVAVVTLPMCNLYLQDRGDGRVTD